MQTKKVSERNFEIVVRVRVHLLVRIGSGGCFGGSQIHFSASGVRLGSLQHATAVNVSKIIVWEKYLVIFFLVFHS